MQQDRSEWWSTPEARREERRGRRNSQAHRRPRGSLTPEQIGQAALQMIDETGLDALSLRRLAASMDIGTATLYGYVRDKDELMAVVRDRLSLEILAEAGHGQAALLRGNWREQAIGYARAFRAVQARHAVPGLWRGGPVAGPHALTAVDRLLGVFRGAGLSDLEASLCCGAFLGLVSTANGWLSPTRPADDEQLRKARARAIAFVAGLPPDELPNVRAMADTLMAGDGDARFEMLLRCFLNAVEALRPQD